ncbi:alpha/beta hydrolase [Stieleria varia]|nr:alpha/beta hydrolase [Stieleria varia]
MRLQIYLFLICILATVRGLAIDVTLLPAHSDQPAGAFDMIDFVIQDGPETKKFRLSVPENRASESSRHIRLYGYQIKARKPSGYAPIFLLGGGPGQFFGDKLIERLNHKPTGGMLGEVWEFAETRDVVFVNQRGAGPAFMSMMFMTLGAPVGEPYDHDAMKGRIQENYKMAIDRCAQQGIDLAGYDIMNVAADLDDVREKLGYEKIVLYGGSFGSQWAFCYMQKYPDHVDRAVLSGIEPIDHGWDSPQGIWNVIKRLEKRIAPDRDKLGFPEVSLTDAIESIVKRLESQPVRAKTGKTEVVIGPADFQRAMLGGHGAHRETHESIAKMPKFVYEIYMENYTVLAAKAARKNSVGASPLQAYLIDNSLDISEVRLSRIDNEPGRRWIGELNATYKATRDVTPTPVIPESFRILKTDLPVLMVQGDLDMSTPFENAKEQMEFSSNAHLIRIHGGTHAAIMQIAKHDPSFHDHVMRFLDADFSNQTIASLKLPDELKLPPIEFAAMHNPED